MSIIFLFLEQVRMGSCSCYYELNSGHLRIRTTCHLAGQFGLTT